VRQEAEGCFMEQTLYFISQGCESPQRSLRRAYGPANNMSRSPSMSSVRDLGGSQIRNATSESQKNRLVAFVSPASLGLFQELADHQSGRRPLAHGAGDLLGAARPHISGGVDARNVGLQGGARRYEPPLV